MRAVGRQAETNKFFSFGAVSAAGGASAGLRAAAGDGRSPAHSASPTVVRTRAAAATRCARAGGGLALGQVPAAPLALPHTRLAGARWGAGAGTAPSFQSLTAMERSRGRAKLRGLPLGHDREPQGVPRRRCLLGHPVAARLPAQSGSLPRSSGTSRARW